LSAHRGFSRRLLQVCHAKIPLRMRGAKCHVIISTFSPIWPMFQHMLEVIIMSIERHVKLFKNGRNQAVRIPREFELPGEDAIMRKEGGKIIIESAPPKSLLAILATLSPLDEDFPMIDDPAPEPFCL